jgi:NitT/TauT family transport system permease protein
VSDGSTLSAENRLRRVVLGTLGIGGFCLVWTIAAGPLPPYLLPSPLDVSRAFASELTTVVSISALGRPIGIPRLLLKLGQSLLHYVPGLSVGCILGTVLGVVMAWNDTVDAIATPLVRILRPIPPLAWIVFAIVWIGIGHGGAAFIVFIGAFWITFYNGYAGVEDAPDELKEVASVFGGGDESVILRTVVLPSALPNVFTGIRTSIGQCWMIVVAAELFGAPGVGYQIIKAAQRLSLEVSVAYMLVISIVFLTSDWLFRRLERRVLAWRT